MEKRVILVFLVILILSVSLVSASWFDALGKITGKVTENASDNEETTEDDVEEVPDSETEQGTEEPAPPEEPEYPEKPDIEKCVEAGGETWAGAPNCCEGLKSVSDCLPEQSCPISLRFCVDCGNGKCDSYENWYNCEKDCKKENPPETECDEGEERYYKCSDGTKIPECICENGKWVCIISPKEKCPDTGPGPTTCAAKIKITFNKEVYKVGDEVKVIIETLDSQGEHIPNYAFYAQMYDNMWHTPDSQNTDNKGYFIYQKIAQKPAGGVTKVKFKVYTKETSSCGSVEDTEQVGFELEECGFGECAPEIECEDKIRKCGGDCPPCSDDGDIFYPCSGCELEDKCYPYGFRKAQEYCSDKNNMFVSQLGDNEVCENNFECKTNLCINGNCVSSNIWNKFLEWFRNIFGGRGPEPGPEICSKLLIQKDIENWDYLESIYGSNKHSQVPVYSEDGDYIDTLKCCMAGYEREETNEEKAALVCQYDDRQDLENSLYWILSKEKDLDLNDLEYKDNKIYGDVDVAIIWTSDNHLVASGGDPQFGTPLSEAITDAYLKKYKNDLEEIDIDVENLPTVESQSCEEIQDNIGQANCYIELAMKNTDSSVCEKIIYNADHRNKCYVNLAEHTGNSNICNKISDNDLKEKCYFWAAGETGNADTCAGITDSDLQAMCYVDLAEKTSDANSCDKITDIHIRDKCYREVAIATNDRSLCEKIVDDTGDLNPKDECYAGTD